MYLKLIRERLSSPSITWSVGAVFIALVVSLPLFSVVGAVFQPDDGAWRHLQETRLLQYTVNSIVLAALTAALTAIIGIGCGWLVAATEFPGRRLLGMFLILPLASPAYLLAYFYADLLDGFGSIRHLPGAAVILSVALYPYVYLLARRAFEQQTAEGFFAARSLGHGPVSAFWRVALPAARPAVAGGLVLVMMETLADFGVADHFAIPTFSTGIFRSWLLMGDEIAALKLSAVLLAVVGLLIWLEIRNRGEREASARLLRPMNRMKLGAISTVLALAACGLPVLVGFVIPFIGFSSMALGPGWLDRTIGILSVVGDTVLVALVAAVIVLAIALLLAYASRLAPGGGLPLLTRFSTLGYALPGALLAVGLLAPMGQADQAVTRFLAQNAGWTGGLVLTGTIVALVYAYVVRFLTVGYNAVQGGLAQVSPTLEGAARSLGESPFGVLRHVHLPIIAPSLGAGGLLVMIDVMRELPATLILRPFGFETLSTRIYRLASDERLAEAATPSLVLLALGVIMVFVSIRITRGR